MAIDDMLQGAGGRPRGSMSRRSGSRAIVFWTLALVAGAAAATLFKWYVDRQQPAPQPVVQVAVATEELPIATTIKAEQVRLIDWPKAAVPPGVFLDAKEVVGRTTSMRILPGEPFMTAKLSAKDGPGGLAALIPKDMRAAAVRVDDVVGVAGFIHPEDRVDVIVTMRARSTDTDPVAKVVLQNVKVLTVGMEMDVSEKNRGKAIPTTVATLLVSPEESEKLALASLQGRLLLTLRNWSDDSHAETPGAIPASLFQGLAPPRPRPVASADDEPRKRRGKREEEPAPPPSPAAEPTPPNEVVEILRGDRYERRKFESKEKSQ